LTFFLPLLSTVTVTKAFFPWILQGEHDQTVKQKHQMEERLQG
jgi:hypothetical protein